MLSQERDYKRVTKEKDVLINELSAQRQLEEKRIDMLEVKLKSMQQDKSVEHQREIDRLTKERNLIIRIAHDEIDCNQRLKKVDKSSQTVDMGYLAPLNASSSTNLGQQLLILKHKEDQISKLQEDKEILMTMNDGTKVSIYVALRKQLNIRVFGPERPPRIESEKVSSQQGTPDQRSEMTQSANQKKSSRHKKNKKQRAAASAAKKVTAKPEEESVDLHQMIKVDIHNGQIRAKHLVPGQELASKSLNLNQEVEI